MASQESFSKSEKELLNKLSSAVDEAEGILKEVASVSGDKAQELRVKAKEVLHKAVDSIGDARETAIERSKELARVTDDYVHDNPWRTIGIAGVAGLLLGVIIARR